MFERGRVEHMPERFSLKINYFQFSSTVDFQAFHGLINLHSELIVEGGDGVSANR